MDSDYVKEVIDDVVGETPPTILIVDDESSVRKVAGIFLTVEGYSVSYASDGLEALKVLEDEQVNLVLTDVMMPNLKGYELEQEMRRRGITTPVVYMSGSVSAEIPEVSRLDNFVPKPFENDQLLETIRKYI